MSAVWSRIRFWWWTRRLARMKACRTVERLRERHGEPAHTVDAGDMVIWHYPLGLIDQTLYSIHVAVIDDSPNQIYLHMEPVRTESGALFRSD